MHKRLLLIINPAAGVRKANRHLTAMVALFNAHGYICTVFCTAGRGDATRIARENARDFDLVVCVGGDGTLNEVLGGMVEGRAHTPIGYVPAGSTNDLATSLKLSKNIMQAAKDIMVGKPSRYDVGCFNGRTFCYIASFGAFTRVSYTTPQNTKNYLGHLAYVLEGMKDIPSIKPVRLRVEVNGVTYEDDYIFGAFSNATSIGGILTMDPSIVKMDDGLLEMVLIRFPQNPVEWSRILFSLNQQQYDPELISFCLTGEAKIYANKSVPWTLDGEYSEGTDYIEIHTVPNAMELITSPRRKVPAEKQ